MWIHGLWNLGRVSERRPSCHRWQDKTARSQVIRERDK
jgi:hypothetical protein